VAEARAEAAASSLYQCCKALGSTNATGITEAVEACPPENITTISTALAQAAVSAETVGSVAEVREGETAAASDRTG
jgi:hypothetical protein